MSQIHIKIFAYRFTIVAVVAGEPYIRVEASNKKDARSGAAYMAWTALLDRQKQKVHYVVPGSLFHLYSCIKLSMILHVCSQHCSSSCFQFLYLFDLLFCVVTI